MFPSRMKPFLGAVALCVLFVLASLPHPLSGQADVVDGDTLSIRGQSARIVSMASILLRDSRPVKTLPANGISVAPGRRMLSQP